MCLAYLPTYLTLDKRKNPGVDGSASSLAKASGVHSDNTGKPFTLCVPVGSSVYVCVDGRKAWRLSSTIVSIAYLPTYLPSTTTNLLRPERARIWSKQEFDKGGGRTDRRVDRGMGAWMPPAWVCMWKEGVCMYRDWSCIIIMRMDPEIAYISYIPWTRTSLCSYIAA